MTNRILRTAFVGSALAGCIVGQATGQISGTVADETGAPVASAYVTYLRTPYTSKDTVPIGGGQYTTKAGQFSFTGLIPATYAFCVQTEPDRGYVPVCDWTYTPPSTRLTAGLSTKVNITIQHGRRIELRMKDAGGLLPTPEDKAPSSFVVFGVRSADGRLHSAQIRSRDPGGHDYWVIVPANQVMQVSVFGSNHAFQDTNGADVALNAAGLSIPAGLAGSVNRLQFTTVKAKVP